MGRFALETIQNLKFYPTPVQLECACTYDNSHGRGSNAVSVVRACGTCPFALLWLPVIADFRVTVFLYISLYERPRGNLKFSEYF